MLEYRLTIEYFADDDEQAKDYAKEIQEQFDDPVSVERRKDNGDMEWIFTAGDDDA